MIEIKDVGLVEDGDSLCVYHSTGLEERKQIGRSRRVIVPRLEIEPQPRSEWGAIGATPTAMVTGLQIGSEALDAFDG